MAEDLHYLELIELAKRIHTKEISPVEVTESQLARIGALDGNLRSYALVTPDLALAQAREAETEILRGHIRGPLHGIPIGVKDLCWMKGVPTAGGMPIHRDFIPDEDATVVHKLREAGAIILGKIQMTEGAFANHHPDMPTPVNPWAADRWTGVSSSGSGVATAAGLCYAALGSDTGGSIRFPSAANGLTGLKPTWGRVSRYGVFELAATLDHIGPMARSAADTAAMLAAMAGPDPKDPTARQDPVPDYLSGIGGGLKGLRIGVDENWNRHGTDAMTQQAVADAVAVVRLIGGDVRTVCFPDPTAVVEAWVPICGVEAAVAHEATYPARKTEYGPALSGLLDKGLSVTGMDYQKMVLARINFAGRLRALFQEIDILIAPAQILASPTNATLQRMSEDPEMLSGMLRFTCPFDMSGNPTITLPCAFTADGTPVGFQFVAPHMQEGLLFRAGHAYQRATDWHRRHPALGVH